MESCKRGERVPGGENRLHKKAKWLFKKKIAIHMREL